MLINEEIRDKEVRLVGETGEQLGIMSARDALQLASEKNLDLVKIAPQATPPVCKIMDYGKYCFEQEKKEKEGKKKGKRRKRGEKGGRKGGRREEKRGKKGQRRRKREGEVWLYRDACFWAKNKRSFCYFYLDAVGINFSCNTFIF